MIGPICRLCLHPENESVPELQFARNLCYCKSGHLHRKCLEEWVVKSGYKNCHRCQCQYNVTFVPQSLGSYIWNSPDEWVKLVQKMLRFLNIAHVSLIIFYFLLFVPQEANCWLPYKPVIVLLYITRTYFNIKAIAIFWANLQQNYRSWKQRNFRVILNDAQ